MWVCGRVGTVAGSARRAPAGESPVSQWGRRGGRGRCDGQRWGLVRGELGRRASGATTLPNNCISRPNVRSDFRYFARWSRLLRPGSVCFALPSRAARFFASYPTKRSLEAARSRSLSPQPVKMRREVKKYSSVSVSDRPTPGPGPSRFLPADDVDPARRRKFWDRPAFARNFAISGARSQPFSLFRGRVSKYS